jgi:hypothetical protein
VVNIPLQTYEDGVESLDTALPVAVSALLADMS